MRVPVEDLRREFEASGLTCSELSRRLGWAREGTSPRPSNGPRVRRVLGYREQDNGTHAGKHYLPSVRRSVNAATAERIRAALREREA